MELSKEQIKRIDSFLEEIGVEYVDIRLEMVDHIATEIEENVNDVDVFFEYKGFQTPFVKFMLSKKAQFLKSYRKQVKRSFWSNTKKIIVDVLRETIYPINLLYISVFFAVIFVTEKVNLKLVTNLVFIGFMASYCYMGILFRRLRKNFGNVRLIQAYTSMLIGGYIIAMYFPILPIPFIDENYTVYGLYKLVMILVLNFLIYKSYLNRKEVIKIYYKTFI
ncbi:hypothetical protein [uncultured Tenacibaculum sp.]|uniref:hypothetical protein n=1 Tax=uncultured Tenacibaculum sp. TaxID=174713 RepID=UPI002605F204|nr:hypothetical protein [uncultured Tenacibaculum sp.]